MNKGLNQFSQSQSSRREFDQLLRTSMLIFLFSFILWLPPSLLAQSKKQMVLKYADKNGWIFDESKIPFGTAVSITLRNDAEYPACFSLWSQSKRLVIKKTCVEAKNKRSIDLSGDFPKGTYEIRNSWESNPKKYIIID
ncbi:MAG: hypothetical protein NT027_07055 [Proteobacteria bacterium]|nr:hypothetical protein [Pseudomonadota bacterium]